MTHQIPLCWKLLVIFVMACGLASFLAWGILLTSFGSRPQDPSPETHRDIAYNFHGATVFISHFESALRRWLIPLAGLFIFLGLLAAVGALIAAGQVRIKVSVDVTDTGAPFMRAIAPPNQTAQPTASRSTGYTLHD